MIKSREPKMPFRSLHPAQPKRRMVFFDYESRFIGDIEKTVSLYNERYPKRAVSLDIYKSALCSSESEVGKADLIGHSGGDGISVYEDVFGVPKFFICHSHQWKAQKEGAAITHLGDYVKGLHLIDIIENDAVLGPKGKLPIMKYHCLAVTRPPRNGRVLATSRVRTKSGDEIEIIEALRYDDKTISVQGHPEEGKAVQVMWNFLNFPESI